MGALFLLIVIGLLWINLVGAGLLAWRWIKDYSIARVTGITAFCLVAFFLENFIGWGPRPPLLPFTTALSVWLIWRDRDVIRAHWKAETWFALGFLYCFIWNYTFPDIDLTSDRMPDLEMIDGYMKGTTLPSPDRWFYPYKSDFYYSFQHYAGALLARVFHLSSGVAYHISYAALVGLITTTAAAVVAKLCPRRSGRAVALATLILGGTGASVAVHVILKENRFYFDHSVNFLGGTIVGGSLNSVGHWLSDHMARAGVTARIMPFPPLSYVLINGDFHPPLSGYLLLTTAALLIATMEYTVEPGRRALFQSLLAATVPLALITNSWIFPLQLGLVGSWLIYRAIRGELQVWKPAIAGVLAAVVLEYPYLSHFLQQNTSAYAAIKLTEGEDRTPVLGWLLMFWPVAGVLLLSLFNREQRPFAIYLLVVWTGALACVEIFYDDDIYGGAWNRYNTSMKWWGWVYAGIILTSGALNLGSRSRLCRYGTLAMLVPTCIYGIDLGGAFFKHAKPSVGRLDGHAWIERDPVVHELLASFQERPDGVTVEGGLKNENTEAPGVSLFAHKQSLLGWPWHETLWRGTHIEIEARAREIGQLYSGTLPDPIKWLNENQVRYILWLPRDNFDYHGHWRPLLEILHNDFRWHQFWNGDAETAIGYWERNESAWDQVPR